MARHKFDKSTKCLIQKHGNGLLYLDGVRQVRSWRALQAELVQPRRLPDGLLEVFFHGRATRITFSWKSPPTPKSESWNKL